MSHDPIDHDLERGMRNRRRILGDAWVDKSLANTNSFNADFQGLITRFAWHEIWGRPGLEYKVRRVIVLASTMALARWEEFELHVRAALLDDSGQGLDPAELKEVLMQAAIYSGVPAANTGISLAQHILAELGMAPEPTPGAIAAHPGVGRESVTASQPALHYTVRPPRSGKAPRHTVVLSHALGCDLDMWDELANRLAADCRVISYDHRGHGASDAPAGPYTMADLADDAARLLRELDSGPVVWIGLSMGGMVGQELALRHPSLVAALVVANSSSGYPDAARAMWQERIAAVKAGGVEAIADAVMGRYFHEDFRAAQPATVARYRRRLVATGTAGYVACCAAVAGVDTTGRLAQVAVPTLVIAGELDAGTPLPMSEAIAREVQHGGLEVIEDASHLSAVEQPERFAALVHQFMLGL
ncbi:bifunctional 4-carboxymuconolactone decarboxylase/3-oxoadipate enol-lactonase PcaCD [Massilia cavernae]|uniref:3-oxoadipate enol-lactonase n=1 Tax=Massilia cavernae TaxID=2320864 RepID=A0A418XGL9_9BURK|nr:3-oxoadipate enol-lactonase [Massilia cavernae]RJG11609.1 3-oxoadipate enol-lactonase [Massilia cavernae]